MFKTVNFNINQSELKKITERKFDWEKQEDDELKEPVPNIVKTKLTLSKPAPEFWKQSFDYRKLK